MSRELLWTILAVALACWPVAVTLLVASVIALVEGERE